MNTNSAALVLLSGGLDSVALLHWAIHDGYGDVRALGFDYGQPSRNHELYAAESICHRLGIRFERVALGDAVRGTFALLLPSSAQLDGVAPANLPARNAIFIMVATAQAARWWSRHDDTEPKRNAHIFLGCNADDASGFPDCRSRFIRDVSTAASMAVAPMVNVFVRAPFVSFSKRDIVSAAAAMGPGVIADMLESVSCYRGNNCGRCDACKARDDALGHTLGTREAGNSSPGSGLPGSGRSSFEDGCEGDASTSGHTTTEPLPIGNRIDRLMAERSSGTCENCGHVKPDLLQKV